MSPRRFAVAVATLAVLATPSAALAKNGDRGTSTGGGSTAPCVTIVAENAGNTIGSSRDVQKFTAVSCSAGAQTYALRVTDAATRVLYPEWDCGTKVYSGPTISVSGGGKTSFELPVPIGTCYPAAEYHSVTVDALAKDGTLVATGYGSWQHQVRTESR